MGILATAQGNLRLVLERGRVVLSRLPIPEELSCPISEDRWLQKGQYGGDGSRWPSVRDV